MIVSLIANEKTYVVEVMLLQGLTPGTSKVLTFTGELTGADDRSLANRILEPISYLLKYFW